MGQVRSLDERLNELKLLRLCTTEPFVQHLGNRLGNPSPLAPLPSGERGKRKPSGLTRRLANLPGMRRILMAVYDGIFRLYYEK
jgi:hypothetical protein